MAARRSARAAVSVALAVLLTTASGGAAAVAAPAAQRDGAAAVIASYQARIPALMKSKHIPGLALAVVDGEHVLWQQGFGRTDDGSSRPVTVDTIFSAQSMSKVFTATAVMQAVQSGRLDLDVPITTYLPGFTVHSAFESHPERKITLRMLLSHTAGFTQEAPLGNNYQPEPGAFDAHVRSISDTWLRFPVGSGYAYSNLGIDLAAYILEQAWQEPFPAVMHDSLLAPLGMQHSTFDRAQVRATADRAVGHSDSFAAEPVDIGMTGAGGLWTSAADLARFLEFQLGNGTVGRRTVLDAAHMTEMRTVPAPDAGAPAGYALGVARTHWRDGQYLDLFGHGGGGFGFLSDLSWLPQLQLGIAVLTNSEEHDLQGTLALGILRDLVDDPDSRYHDRMLGLPTQSDVVEPDGQFVAPPDLTRQIARLALPASSQQSARWAGYAGYYRTGQLGAMSPDHPPSRFYVESGVAYFDASEDGTPVRHRLSEFQPGVFLAENGETLDLRGPSPRWRGMDLNPVSNGPLAAQWALVAFVVIVATGWLVAGIAASVRRRRRGTGRSSTPGPPAAGRTGRRLTAAVAAVGALAALVTVALIRALPGLVDVGFLGRMAFPLPVRIAFHLPLAVALLAASLAALLVAGFLRHWWTPRIKTRDVALAFALTALAAQLASWHLVAWGF